MPVGMNDCTMNKICWNVEKKFDNYVSTLISNNDFDYRILKSNVDYSQKNYNNIESIYKCYIEAQKSYYVKAKQQRIEKEDRNIKYQLFKEQFKQECSNVCSNEKELCDILLDMCYSNNKSKQFVWDICGNVIIDNLLEKNNNQITYLVQDSDGDVEYCGNKFKKIIKTIVED